jgi:oxygen-independent coproporphyrinogen-3 oxidase
LSGALEDLEAALQLEPKHLSHYQLTLEPGTIFGARAPAGLPDHDAAAQMQLACQQRLQRAGYVQYEVSAYARDGSRCRHNLNYWQFGDYLGIGAGAHGKCSRIEAGRLQVARRSREREPRRYLAAPETAPRASVVSAAELPFEFLMNTLRLVEGFSEPMYAERTGLDFGALAAPLARLQGRGLLERSAGRTRASPLGFSFLNDLLAEFLETADPVASAGT